MEKIREGMVLRVWGSTRSPNSLWICCPSWAVCLQMSYIWKISLGYCRDLISASFIFSCLSFETLYPKKGTQGRSCHRGPATWTPQAQAPTLILRSRDLEVPVGLMICGTCDVSWVQPRYFSVKSCFSMHWMLLWSSKIFIKLFVMLGIKAILFNDVIEEKKKRHYKTFNFFSHLHLF